MQYHIVSYALAASRLTGELAESNAVYAHGLEQSPRHAQLQAEARKAAAYPPTPSEAQAAVATMTDGMFEAVQLPVGSFSLKGQQVSK